MCQGEHAIAIVLIVQQDEGLGAVCATTIGPATLTRGLIDVDPALGKAFSERAGIVLAERSQSGNDGIARLLIADLFVGFLNNRHVEVVHVQFVEVQRTFA